MVYWKEIVFSKFFNVVFFNTSYCAVTVPSSKFLFSVIGADFWVGIAISPSSLIEFLCSSPLFANNCKKGKREGKLSLSLTLFLSVLEMCCHLSENFSSKFLRPWKLKLGITVSDFAVASQRFTDDHICYEEIASLEKKFNSNSNENQLWKIIYILRSFFFTL